MVSLLLPLLWTGCWCPPLVDGGETGQDDGSACREASVASWGPAPGDGLALEYGPSWCEETGEITRGVAWFGDGAGQTVTVEPQGICGRWLARGYFPPGTWHFSGWEEQVAPWNRWTIAGEHAVEPWGHDPAFRSSTVAHSDWLLDLDAPSCTAMAWLLHVEILRYRALWLRIGEVDDHLAQVALVVSDAAEGRGNACVALEGDAFLTDEGRLLWIQPSFTFPSQEPLPAWDLRLEAAFDAWGQEARGGFLSFSLDLASTANVGSLCTQAAAQGLPCEHCASGGSMTCVSLESWAGVPERRDADLLLDLPPCEVALRAGAGPPPPGG